MVRYGCGEGWCGEMLGKGIKICLGVWVGRGLWGKKECGGGSVVIWKYSREVRVSESESERCLGVRITIEYA